MTVPLSHTSPTTKSANTHGDTTVLQKNITTMKAGCGSKIRATSFSSTWKPGNTITTSPKSWQEWVSRSGWKTCSWTNAKTSGSSRLPIHFCFTTSNPDNSRPWNGGTARLPGNTESPLKWGNTRTCAGWSMKAGLSAAGITHRANSCHKNHVS